MTKFNYSRAWIIAAHEYLTSLRQFGFLFFTFLPPVLGFISLIIAAFFSGQASRFFQSQFTPKTAVVGVVDQTGLYTPVPAAFAKQFANYPDEAAARQALKAEAIGAYVVIPADYVAAGKLNAYVREGGFISGASLADSSELTPLLVQGLLAGKVDAATLQRAGHPADVAPITLNAQGEPTTGSSVFSVVSGFIVPYILSIFLVIAIFTASSYLLRSVSEEKETRVIEIILSSVSASELLAGKVVGLGALGLTQMGVWILSAFAFTGGAGALLAGAVIALNPMVFVLAALYFLLGYLVYGTLMAAAGSLGSNMRESQQMAGLFSFMAAVPYMLNGFIWMNPNMPLARALSYFPLTAPTMMMLRLPLGGVPTVDIVVSLTVLLVTIPVCIWGGAKVFRTGLLLYGKRPSLRQIWRILREA